MTSSPRIITQTGAVRHWSSKKRPVSCPSSSSCSGVKALRNTSVATAAKPPALLVFRSLGAVTTCASGHAERLAALALIEPHADRSQPITLGADKGYDTSDFVMELRDKAVTPHVAQNQSRVDLGSPSLAMFVVGPVPEIEHIEQISDRRAV